MYILQAVQDAREDLRLHDNLSEVHGVLRDLGQAAADLALEGGVDVRDILGQQSDRTGVNNLIIQNNNE